MIKAEKGGTAGQAASSGNAPLKLPHFLVCFAGASANAGRENDGLPSLGHSLIWLFQLYARHKLKPERHGRDSKP